MKLLSQQLQAYNCKTSASGAKAPTKVRRISPLKHCPRGVHENGPKFWERAPTDAERILLPRARSATTCTRDRPTAKQKRNGQGISSSFFLGAIAHYTFQAQPRVSHRRSFGLEIHIWT
ncbi:trans-sialidase [Trypanosoma rangeli]|uniref:Trans-sialidase n=1 Tax=Trypanosoma rangeli TaxID=5698 RepID=A0A3R7K6P4_TRYRA|nr:trans-sialidase [Trypanosoma rangeli]RNF02639.1 trans-sialidase [Trypanosoma rangeli]|eukprot:RNF02639.1 trans-sialidase [Trypanosoma rangeli]